MDFMSNIKTHDLKKTKRMLKHQPDSPRHVRQTPPRRRLTLGCQSLLEPCLPFRDGQVNLPCLGTWSLGNPTTPTTQNTNCWDEGKGVVVVVVAVVVVVVAGGGGNGAGCLGSKSSESQLVLEVFFVLVVGDLVERFPSYFFLRFKSTACWITLNHWFQMPRFRSRNAWSRRGFFVGIMSWERD